jgi:hypothetical protein
MIECYRSVEGWPSGQRQQTVNLPAYAYVGSNPTPSTIKSISLTLCLSHCNRGMHKGNCLRV